MFHAKDAKNAEQRKIPPNDNTHKKLHSLLGDRCDLCVKPFRWLSHETLFPRGESRLQNLLLPGMHDHFFVLGQIIVAE